MNASPLFQSFFLGGFECSTHRLRRGRRLDVIAATGHDRWAAQDYQCLAGMGLRTVRDGVRWHRIEKVPGRYCFGSLRPMLRAARETGTQVIWDLCHYGWPDDIDIFRPAFVDRFARFVRATARVVRDETEGVPFFCPVNEISFLCWAGGDVEYLNPFCRGRGDELKCQLVRAAIAAVEAIRDVAPEARICHVEPVINIVGRPGRPDEQKAAEAYRQAQFQAFDWISGRLRPDLGGRAEYLDVIGLNYYCNNQWVHGRPTLRPHSPLYRPLWQMMAEVWERYRRPLLISETGIEAEERAPWMAMIGEQVRLALQHGVPVEGICWYPIVNHPGWDNDRHCPNGLWGYPDNHGHRTIHQPLAEEIRRQQRLIGAVRGPVLPREHDLYIELSA